MSSSKQDLHGGRAPILNCSVPPVLGGAEEVVLEFALITVCP